MIGKTTVKRFLTEIAPYIENGRTISEFVAELVEARASNYYDIKNETDRASFAKKQNREIVKMLTIADMARANQFLPIIGGNAVTGIAVELNIDIVDLGMVRNFVNN